MSYEIFYDKRFVKVADDKVIPIFQHGSSNCFEIGWSGREVPEKNWSVINYPFFNRYIFSKEEIGEMSNKMTEQSLYKSRSRSMTDDEVRKFYTNAYKSAKTLEYYLELGNSFELRDSTDWKNPIRYNPTTSDELIALIEQLSGEGKKLTMGFTNRDFYKPRRNIVKKEKTRVEQDHCFALKGVNGYLYKLRKHGYAYVGYSGSAKLFDSEKKANSYLRKYEHRLSGFDVVKLERQYFFYK